MYIYIYICRCREREVIYVYACVHTLVASFPSEPPAPRGAPRPLRRRARAPRSRRPSAIIDIVDIMIVVISSSIIVLLLLVVVVVNPY